MRAPLAESKCKYRAEPHVVAFESITLPSNRHSHIAPEAKLKLERSRAVRMDDVVWRMLFERPRSTHLVSWPPNWDWAEMVQSSVSGGPCALNIA